jgi:hypothetical protein
MSCRVLEHAKKDYQWGIENSERLCCGNCEKCPHYDEVK